MRALVLALLVACTGTSAPPSRPSGPPASLEAPRAAPDDVIVAQVNGRPVWGSCVATQARRGAPAKVALDQCVDFELLAQAAERRGLASDRDVAVATRTALVSQLVAHEFEDRFQRPEDFGDAWNQLIGRNLARIKHDEYRSSAYARVPVPEGASAEADAAAHRVAERIADALAPETGLMSPQFFEIAQRVAGPVRLDRSDVEPHTRNGLEEHYAAALFELPAIGRTSRATRTKWGWDIVLWTDVLPAADPTPEQIATDMLPAVKRAYFSTWVNKITTSLGIHVEIDQASVARLEDLP